MPDLFDTEPGQTPLDPDEREALIPGHIQVRSELNEWEAMNISKAQRKYLFGPRRRFDLHDPEFLKKIHKEMFDETWKWAGAYRRSDKNFGVPWWKIPEEMKKVGDDFKYWKENKTYSPLEIALRYHHRIICVHAFANGNGRHGRLVADLFIRESKAPTLTWGSKEMIKKGEFREFYMQAMRKADRGDFSDLNLFATS